MEKVKRKPRQWTQEEIEEAKSMYESGMNFEQISREMNRPSVSVRLKLQALKIHEVEKVYLWNVLEVRGHIINIDEAKETTHKSHKKLLFKCSTDGCNTTKNMRVQDLVNHGFSCQNCSTGTSYPELFFLSVNQHFKLDYEYQQAYEHGRFDFINHDTKTVVEMNGMAHYQEVGDSNSWTNAHKKTRLSDNKKRKWCEENGYTLIFIDARKSDFKFIQDNINKCKLLPTITDEDIEPMLEIMEQNKRYPVKEIIDAYLRARKNTYQIAEHYGYSYKTINDILRRNNVPIKTRTESRGKKVRCIETGIVYASIMDVQRETGINQSSVGKCCLGKQNSAGKHPITGEKLTWEYLSNTEENAFHRAKLVSQQDKLDTIELDSSDHMLKLLSNNKEKV